jgi:hypothetical protein
LWNFVEPLTAAPVDCRWIVGRETDLSAGSVMGASKLLLCNLIPEPHFVDRKSLL